MSSTHDSTASPDAPVLIGVDSGGAGFRAHRVQRLPGGGLRPIGSGVELRWDHPQEFQPLPLALQLEQRQSLEAGAFSGLGESGLENEREAAARQVHALAKAAESLVRQANLGNTLQLGLCMNGLRDPRNRGIVVCRHGPRCPDLLDRLEEQLVRRGLTLAAPLPPLASDGQAAGWGEDASPEGALRGVTNAYYLGAGTGVAEALKLDGVHWDVGSIRDRLPAPWAQELDGGRTLEDALSMSGLAEQRRRRGGRVTDPVPLAARAGDSLSRELLEQSALALGRLLLARMDALWDWGEHLLDRIVIGQRSGETLADEALDSCYRRPLEQTLEAGLRRRQDKPMAKHTLVAEKLRPGFLRASILREAPALGMAARALNGGAAKPTGA